MVQEYEDCGEELSLEDEEMLEAFDGLIEDIKMSREDGVVVSAINPHKLEAMQFAYLAIKKALCESGCDATVICKQSELAPNVGVVSVEGKEIDMKNLEWFCRAAEFADNTEVYPLKDNKVRLTFGFNRLLNPL